jgi:structural maintenance of chromosome 4
MAPWTEKIRQEQDALEGAVLALSAFERKQKSSEGEVVEAETRLSALKSELRTTQQSRSSLHTQQSELSSQVSHFQQEIEAGDRVLAEVNSAVSTIQTTLAEANETLRQNNSGHAVLSALMKESAAGRIKGVHGRLGDLGIIDNKFDIAISTACSSLNFVVVDTTATGQKCVEFLRKNGLGRASFIILDKMRHAELRPSYLPAGATRLFDLVKVKAELFLSAFYFALNDTLVAENMEQARKLAYNERRRFRVVTLDGKLLDTSGTMSGGGNQLQQGGMKASFAPEISREQLAALNNLLNEKQTEQKNIKAALIRFHESLARTKAELKRTEIEISKSDLALNSLPSQVSDLEETLSGLK